MFLVPGKFDKVSLQPLYERVFNEAQLPADPTKIMFFEPGEFPDQIGILGGFVFNLGFTEPPGGEIGSPLHVLNDHSYCCQLDPFICATGEPDISKKDECKAWHYKRVGTRAEDAERYGIPLFISEFGACLNSSSCVMEINALADVCDEFLSGWAYWQLKNFADLTTSAGTGSEGFYNNDGTLQEGKVKALTRTYMMSTQGVLRSMQFNTESSNFESSFDVNTSIQQPSVLYYNSQYWYPNGFNIVLYNSYELPLTEGRDYTLDISQPNYLKFTIINSSLNGQSVTIQLTPKSHTASI